MSPAAKLRANLANNIPIIAPGVYDALTALMVQQAGFSCAYVSGASVSFTKLGRPDLGLTTMSEVADSIARMRERVEIPLVVDADTGFGNALNVQRTVKLFERSGASAIQLEDQTLPKRCGHLAGKTLVSTGEMVGKLSAALDARVDADTMIVARTDALAVEGIDAALDRAEQYADAGADMLFVEAPRDEAQLKLVSDRLAAKVPLLVNMVEGGRTPLMPADKLAKLGFSLVIYPGAMVRVITKAAQDYLTALNKDGTTANILDNMLDFSQVMELVGLSEMVADGQNYACDLKSATDHADDQSGT
ncbi:MAG: oxaloacetate decarboxylase [Gammaproteobacteria bacterium]|jgi:2-methylisocitrate lyase-like PEP mutase family enzyme|nr:oxaloacetate decarboxylase [Gammaproteobacteria bacterium]